ncbi:hypothetical protein J6S88_01780 [bacterium]|nr:hypothetical protein [bacterium]
MLLHAILSDPPIMIVAMVFLFSVFYTVRAYRKVGKNLKIIDIFLSNFKKTDLNYRFNEFDEWMCANSYVAHLWLEFKNTLVFSESVALKDEANEIVYKEISSTVQNIQTTEEPGFFFNEETLVFKKYNYKLINSFPTILTGFGPLFTFLNIAIAFGKVDFSNQTTTIASISGLMASMQIAALVSVIAVGSSLIYILLENTMYAMICRPKINAVEEKIAMLFDNISSEKFLLELLRETKIQNNSSSNLVSSIPDSFQSAINSGIASNLVPYLENLIFGINQMSKQLKTIAKKTDDVDDLF